MNPATNEAMICQAQIWTTAVFCKIQDNFQDAIL